MSRLKKVKKKVGARYTPEFRQQAVERMSTCTNVVQLARELGVSWRQLYRWRDQALATHDDGAEKRERALQEQIGSLKAALADEVLKVSFFRGALQKIEARRQSGNASGKPASTGKSGK